MIYSRWEPIPSRAQSIVHGVTVSSSAPLSFHVGDCIIFATDCQNRIRGIRYKCAHALCPDYDLCEDCEALPIPVHPHDHPLIKIRNTHVVVPHTHQTLIEDDFAPNNHMHLTRELISLLAASRRT